MIRSFDAIAGWQLCTEPIGIPSMRKRVASASSRQAGSPSVGVPGQDGRVLIVRATQKLLRRVGPPTLRDGEHATTLMGEWYATALFWKPQVALLVNETTLLPVLMPLAPAVTLPTRIAPQIATVLTAHGTPPVIVEDELHRMRPCRLARTANRSVVGVMTEFTHLAEVYRDSNPDPNLLDLALRLATTPCGPLYGSTVSPDRALGALLRSSAT